MQIPRSDERHRNLIGGEWRPPSTGEHEPCLNPADTREVIGLWPRSGAADAKAAVDAAAKAFPDWSRTPGPERGRILGRAHQILKAKIDLLAEALCREEGKTLSESRGEVMKGLNLLEFYSGEGFRTHGKTLPSETRQSLMLTLRQPVGPVTLITPWNFPFAIPVWKTAPALVAGCTVVLKPASLTPVCTHLLAEALVEAGLPPGVINVVTGPGGAIGNALVDDPRIRAVSFTGSNSVGLKLYERAARRGIKVTCEMGGKNPVIVDSDADLDEAIVDTIYSAFGYQGQKCSACSRLIVLEENYDRVVKRLVEAAASLRVGNPEEPGITVGPVIDETAYRRMLETIETGKKEATLAFQGEAPPEGFFVPPTIFTDVKPHMLLSCEEIFGPVLSVLKVRDLAEAIQVANDTDYALTAGFFSRSPANIERVKAELVAGNVYINRSCTGAVVGRHPFGGFKMSGGGTKAGGGDYLLQFMVPRVVTENIMRHGFAPDTTPEFREPFGAAMAERD